MQDLVDYQEADLLKALAYTVAASNMFFRTMRSHGVWVPEPDRTVVLHSGEAMCDTQLILR